MNMCQDSRALKPGDWFVAVPGLTVDGRHFIQEALDRGAAKIFYESQGSEQFVFPKTSVPLIPIAHLSEQQGPLAAAFYGNPSRLLTTIGVTGTNGKTSITYFIAQCLPETAVLGTTGYGRLNQLHMLMHTTPMAIEVQRILKILVEDHCKTVAMEVSSHALAQHRVAGVEFDIAVFTNLSQDHLDFHGSMADYAEAKKKLFEWTTLNTMIVNRDDVLGRDLIKRHQKHKGLLTYSMSDTAEIMADAIQFAKDGFEARITTPWGRALFYIPLLGHFNIQNCLAVIGVLGSLGVSLDEIVMRIAQLKSPPGRMQVLTQTGKPTVVVDFAHTPDALQQTLQALRTHGRAALYCIVGCGGNRDAGKRPLMGKIASDLSDYVIITNDNPRQEDPKLIAASIASSVNANKLLGVVLDRYEAISKAIQHASPEDIVVIAGKGHEDYQIIGDERIPFSDVGVVKELLGL